MEARLHNRRQQAEADLGLNDEKEQAQVEKALQEEQERQQKKEERKNEIEESSSYMAIKKISQVMDDYYLDPILGFFFPAGIGDALPSILIIPYIHVSLGKVHSIPLTLAVIYNCLKDILLGMIPFFIGDIIDIFNKGYKENLKLIVGFVEDDKEIIQKVNKKAFGMAVSIIIICILIYFLVKWIIALTTWTISLFS